MHTHYTVNCGTPLAVNVDSEIEDYNSTLEDSTLQFRCKEGIGVFTATCSKNGSWIPNPDSHTCTTVHASSELGIIYKNAQCIFYDNTHKCYVIYVYV